MLIIGKKQRDTAGAHTPKVPGNKQNRVCSMPVRTHFNQAARGKRQSRAPNGLVVVADAIFADVDVCGAREENVISSD